MQTCGTANAIKTLSNAADHLYKHTQLYSSTGNVYHEHLVICVIISTLSWHFVTILRFLC